MAFGGKIVFCPALLSFFFFKDFYLSIYLSIYLLIYLLERGEGKEKERERNINVLLLVACLLLGTWLATQACALTGNQTSDSLVRGPALNLLSHTSQGCRTVLPTTLFLAFLLLSPRSRMFPLWHGNQKCLPRAISACP